MATNYGVRYLTVGQFVRYCSMLGVRTDKRELEHYESNGLTLPVARVIYPDDYVTEQHLSTRGQTKVPPKSDKWPEIPRLSDKVRFLPDDWADLKDEQLLDPFDREMGSNPYLFRPTLDTYRPWDSYRVLVSLPDGNQHQRTTVKHYYSYWQVYQLYYIQQYPDFYQNRFLLDFIANDIKRRFHLPRGPRPEALRDFKGMARAFDVLSFWITMYNREHHRTFSLIPEKHGVRHLDTSQSNAYRHRLQADAKSVQARYRLTTDGLYEFLQQLLELHTEYQNAERTGLANELRNDIFYQAQLIQLTTGEEWGTIEEELGKRSDSWMRRRFRQLDILIKERDDAYELLAHYAGKYSESLAKLNIADPRRSFSSAEINGFLDYCQSEGLLILVTALSGMIATEDEYAEKFRPVSRYTNLKNALTALEFLLKNLADKGGIVIAKPTLNPTIRAVMKNEVWHSLFTEKTECGLTTAKNSAEFFERLNALGRDPDLIRSEETYWARTFLIASLARNLTVHTFPYDDWFYGESFGDMLEAAIYSVLYSWQLAKLEKWV